MAELQPKITALSLIYEKPDEAKSDFDRLAGRMKMLSTFSSEIRGYGIGLFDRLVLNPSGKLEHQDTVVSVIHDSTAHYLIRSLNEAAKHSPGFRTPISADAIFRNLANPRLRAAIIDPDGTIQLLDLRKKQTTGYFHFALAFPQMDQAA